MADKVECDKCGKEFETERGMHIHAAQVHADTDEKRDELIVMEMIHNGKKTVDELVDSLGWDESRVKERLDELKEKDYVKKNVEASRDAFYTLTERGQKELPELVTDLVEETKEFVDGVRGSFEKHLGPLLPKVDVEFPRKKKKEE